MRKFKTGATRNSDEEKLDFEAFLAPSVIERYAEYMHVHRFQEDGGMRDGDNWQKGIPREAYMKSLWRHFFQVWKIHRGGRVFEKDREILIDEAICAAIFNLSGYLFEHLKEHEG